MMGSADQIRLGERPAPAEPPRFLTDDELDRCLSQIENGLAHLEAIVPAMRREIARIRGALGVTMR